MRLTSLAITTVLALLFSLPALAGDPAGIFPPLPAAESAVHWKNGYFYINGKPSLIMSGSIHYARVPRELWADRIWRLKMMGFNCVQSYVFWNATEPKEGTFELTDNVDLDGWLTLLQKMGMYALVRVGPYSCAEWEEGGTPAWLTIKPGMIQREMGPSLPYSDVFLAKIEKIVGQHQINHGGNVFMAQLENEHSRGWGTMQDDPYLKYLDDGARANGLEIPLFNSGLHHSQDPAGESPFPANGIPWYSTEFWTGWINHYGDMAPGMLNEKIAGTWKILAFGGAGYNYYMAHGGTNFGYSGSGELPGDSYDYSAPIGEAGQLRNFYFPARRAAYFGRTFTDVLVGSHNDPDFAKASQPDLRVTTRTNPGGGSIIFLDHFQQKVTPKNQAEIAPEASAYHAPKADPNSILETNVTAGGLTLPHQGVLKVAVSEPRTIIVNLPWTDNATFESICTNVLFRRTLGGIDYWVCYGPAGDSGEITLKRRAANNTPSQLDFTYPSGSGVAELALDSGDGRQAKFLVMNTEMTNRAWWAHDKIIVGPSFVLEDGSLEFPPEGGKATIYSAQGKSERDQAALAAPAVPALKAWSWRDAATERSPGLATTGWLKSHGPQPMETYDDFENRYGWYRTNLHRATAGPVSLHLVGQSGDFVVYLNGRPATTGSFRWGDSATLTIPNAQAGDNALAILVKAAPRPKTTYAGAVGTRLARGIWGGVSEDNAPTPLTVAWKKWDKAPRTADPDEIANPTFDDSTWPAVQPDTLGQAIKVSRGDTWYRASFTLTQDQVDSILETPLFTSPKIPGSKSAPQPAKTICYVNGHPLDERVQDVSRFLVAGKNTILLEIQSRLGAESGELALSLWHNSPLTWATWYFHPGLDNLDETAVVGRATNWADFLNHQSWLPDSPAAPGQPTFWKCIFAYHQPAGMHETLGLETTGLKAGHVWLNGHNLGESPQPYPLYMPECWLKDGDNDLVIFDIEGSKPDEVQLSRYEIFAVKNAE